MILHRPTVSQFLVWPFCLTEPRIEYRPPVAFRRYSSIRGRRVHVDEALVERFLMRPAGYQFLLPVAPRIDKVLIPRTIGRCSSSGFDKVGLVTTTGAKSGLRALIRWYCSTTLTGC